MVPSIRVRIRAVAVWLVLLLLVGLAYLLVIGPQEPAVRLEKPAARSGEPRPRHHLVHGWNVHACAFSPDGKFLATTSTSDDGAGQITLWYVPTGEEQWRLTNITPVPRQIAFSPDGRWLAATAGRGVIMLVDRHIQQFQWTSEEAEHYPTSEWLAFSPDSQKLASGGYFSVHIWNVATGKLERSLSASSDSGAAWAADSKTIVQCLENVAKLRFVDSETGETVRTFQLEDWPQWAAFVHNGQDLLYTSSRHDIVDSEKYGRFMETGVGPLLFKREEAFTIIGRLTLCDATTLNPRRTIDVAEFDIDSMAVSAEGTRVAIGGQTTLGEPQRQVMLYDLSTGKLLWNYASTQSAKPLAVALSPDGRYLATAGEGNMAKLWKLK